MSVSTPTRYAPTVLTPEQRARLAADPRLGGGTVLRLALAASPPDEPRERAELELRVEEVTAELDALTGLYGEDAP